MNAEQDRSHLHGNRAEHQNPDHRRHNRSLQLDAVLREPIEPRLELAIANRESNVAWGLANWWSVDLLS